MAKLNPPILEGIIPCFYQLIASPNDVPLDIPFVMNRSVGFDDINAMRLKFKTIGGIELGDIRVDKSLISISGTSGLIHIPDLRALDEGIGNTIFQKLNIGQYYKIQLAYVSTENSVVGYYSSVGVIKFTAEPTCWCGQPEVYEHVGYMEYEGMYKPNELDPTEKWYSYRFDLLEMNGLSGIVIDTTGEQLHTNIEVDYERYVITKNLDTSKTYKVKFYATTVNKKELSFETTVEFDSLPAFPETCTINILKNYDNGYFTVNVSGEDLSDDIYILWRYSSKTQEWNILSRHYHLSDTYYDFTIEDGIEYTYALQAEDQDILVPTSERKLATPQVAHFEDMFINDKNRQLKIRFNPKVNTFKIITFEAKTDTLGGEFPIFSKNGNAKYRQIDFGGLVSYLMDEQDLFHVFPLEVESFRKETNNTYNDPQISSTATTNENIYKERVFRTAVMNWLTNGEPKYFRSITEGNYIIKLLNPSFTPNDTTGRMIYSFTTTSYEMDKDTRENLIKYNLVEEG